MSFRRAAPFVLLPALVHCDSGHPPLPGPWPLSFVGVQASTTAGLALVPFDVDEQDLVGPDSHNAQYGKLPEIVAAPRPNGLDLAVQSYADPERTRTFVLRYADAAGSLALDAVFEAPTLGLLLGYVPAADGGFYYATGTPDDDVAPHYPKRGKHRADVVRVYRADANGQVLFDVDVDLAREAFDLDSEPLVNPGVASSARLGLAGNQLALVHGNNTPHDPDVNARHQKAQATYFDASTGELTDAAGIWVSHSFDERYLADGDDLYEVHLGDAYPRSVVVSRIRGGSNGGAFPLYAPKGRTGDNNTYARLGGFARIDAGPGAGGFLALFATERGDVTGARVNGPRDLAVVRTVADFAGGMAAAAVDSTVGATFDVTSGGETKTNRVVFLTDFAAGGGDGRHAERPKLLALGGGEFLVLFEQWTVGTSQTFDGTFALRIDGAGAVLAGPTRVADGHLPRGDDAFLRSGSACFVTGDRVTSVLTMTCVAPDLTATALALP